MEKGEFNKEIGRKLRAIREKLGMTLEQVSDLMDFPNYQTLLNIESGKRSIKAQELSSLAKIYCVDVESILLNKREKPVTVLWRNRNETLELKRREQEFIKICRDYELLEKKCGLEPIEEYKTIRFEHQRLDYDNVKKIADKFVRCYGFGDMPSYSIEKILEESLGIKIIYLDLTGIGSAASTIGDFGAAILVNRREAPWRIKFNIAHEFFHIITWDIVNKEEICCREEEDNIIEKFANCFASCLLLPEKPIIEEVNKRVKNNELSFNDFIYIARKFYVSTEAFLWRLVGLGICNADGVRKSLEEGTIKSLDKEKRKGDWYSVEFPIISERYIYLALKSFGKGLISKGKLAEFLGVERAELPKLLESYGYNEEGERDIACTVSTRHRCSS